MTAKRKQQQQKQFITKFIIIIVIIMGQPYGFCLWYFDNMYELRRKTISNNNNIS